MDIYTRTKVESTIEDILLLYAADSMSALDKSFNDDINWNGAAMKAAYKLGRNLGELFEEITFEIPCLDIALEKGRNDQLQLTQKMSENPANFDEKIQPSRVGT